MTPWRWNWQTKIWKKWAARYVKKMWLVGDNSLPLNMPPGSMLIHLRSRAKNTSKHQCWCDWRGTLPADFLRNIVDVSLWIPVLNNVQRSTMKGPVLMEVRAGIWFWVYLCEAKTNECRVCSWLYVVAWIVVVWTYHIVRKKKTVMCASSISM